MVTDKKKLDVGAILAAADAGGFAVPAFNYSDIWDFLAIIEAAEEMDAPIFISSNQQVVTDIGIELTGALARQPWRRRAFHSSTTWTTATRWRSAALRWTTTTRR